MQQFVGDLSSSLKTYSYFNMVTEQAWKTWKRLPLHTRAWIGIEDLILDGLQWTEVYARKQWSKDRGAKFGTFLYWGLHNHFETSYVQRYCQSYETAGRRRGSQKRCEAQTISIQDQEQWYLNAGMDFELERALGLSVESQKAIETKFTSCLVVENVVKLYAQAPERLQQKIREWFLGSASWQQPKKYHTHTSEFMARAREFRRTADRHGITIQDCRHLLSSPQCLDTLSRELVWMPFDFKYPVAEEGLWTRKSLSV